MDYVRKDKRCPNPKENAGVCSRITFLYALKTLREGLKKEFTEDDVYETLLEHKSEDLGNVIDELWQNEVSNALKFKKSVSLHKIVLRMFLRDLLLIGLALGILFLVIRPIQAITVANLTRHFSNTSAQDLNDSTANAVLFTCSTLFSVIIFHPATMGLMNIGLKMKIACSSLIYNKILKLHQNAFQQTSIGQIINLISNDVDTLYKYALALHYLWIGPLQTILYLYLMYQKVGLSSVFGTAFLMLFMSFYLFLGRAISKYRVKVSLKRDERLKLTNEIIKEINTIKMQTWEKPFSQLVSDSRNAELKYIRIGLYLKGFLHLQTIFTILTLFITVLVHVLLNNKINAEKVFLLANLYNNIAYTMTTLFPQGIITMREAVVSFKRLEALLMLDEVSKYTKTNEKLVTVSLENATVQWNKNINQAVLQDISLVFLKGELNAVIGPVGSGKSTLLQTILNETFLARGDVVVNGTVSYSSQKAWIFSGTIQDNILFGSVYDEERYKTIIKICGLDKDFEMLPYKDNTLVGEIGMPLSGGQKSRLNLARALYKDANTYLLDDPLSAVDVYVEKKIFFECFKHFLKGKTVILVTHQLQYLHEVDNVFVLCNGQIQSGQQAEDKSLYTTKIVSTTKTNNDAQKTATQILKDSPKIELETRSSGSVAWPIYKYYIAGCHSYCLVFTTVILFILSQTFIGSTSYFLKYWVNLEQDNTNISRIQFIIIYFVITIATATLTISRMLVLYITCTRSSKRLHTNLLTSIFQAKSIFFATNSTGRILNRFSKDINVVDEDLPSAVIVMLDKSLSILGSIILIVIVKPWILLLTSVMAFMFYFLNSNYLLSSISLKRLERITKSPVLEHLITLCQGLPTVRAFEKQDVVKKMFYHHQDLHSSIYHLTLTTSRAFGFWLDIICVCYITIITFAIVINNSETYGGNVGLLLTQAIQLLGHFQLATKQCAEIENHMTSVERLREYNDIEHEETKKLVPVSSWPEKGKIEFHDVNLKYTSSIAYVLKNINFTIEPQQKIGIVGRTGSGKSSLVSVLFHLVETEGFVTIDNVNIKNVNLHNLRSKLSIIPQNPLLFSDTIRKNLDVFNNHKDEVLWKTLEEVKLKEVFVKLNLDLDSKILEDGCNLSVGQKQLVCLARAILSKKKILILDEATASIDLATDNIIQKIVREKFVNCTVLTVAHRLLTVMDSDKILVMQDGNIVEFDHPYVLLQNECGVLRNMVHQSNEATLTKLIEIAKNTYNGTVKDEEN